jgi:hypothetical protein
MKLVYSCPQYNNAYHSIVIFLDNKYYPYLVHVDIPVYPLSSVPHDTLGEAIEHLNILLKSNEIFHDYQSHPKLDTYVVDIQNTYTITPTYTPPDLTNEGWEEIAEEILNTGYIPSQHTYLNLLNDNTNLSPSLKEKALQVIISVDWSNQNSTLNKESAYE